MLARRAVPLLLALLFPCVAAFAQTVFKSTMPDGRVIYSEKPIKGAQKVDEIKPRTEDTGVRPADRVKEESTSQRDIQREKRGEKEEQEKRVAELEKAVKDAEAAVAAGKEPLPGERAGTANGGTRLTEQFFERQRSLEEAVVEAKKQLAQAKAAAAR